jgi:transposase-like protein
MDHAEVIAELGGPLRVAEALDVHISQPYRWRQRGIPPGRWLELTELASGRGLGRINVHALAKGRQQHRNGGETE